MKYIVLVGDGMADYPIEELGMRTPLEAGRTPNMDFIAKNGQLGQAKTIPDKMNPASDVANLSILGYDPKIYYSGRGPLEAATLGVFLEDNDVAFRCNLVTVLDNKLIDYSAGHPYDIVIFDRCIFDAYCWMMYWEQKGGLNEEETAIIQLFFLLRFWVDKIDAAYFMVCEPEVAAKRELRVALSQKLGETTSPKSVASLVERYKKAFAFLSPQYPQLRLLDTTHMDEQTMIERIATETLNILEKKANGKK